MIHGIGMCVISVDLRSVRAAVQNTKALMVVDPNAVNVGLGL